MRWVACAMFCTVVTTAGSVKAEPVVDWQRGLVVASAGAPADLRAPTTELARVKAERVAKARCRKELRKAASGLRPSEGGKWALPAGTQLGLITMGTDQGSDGSVVVTMALPIDRLRTIRYGADVPREAPSTAPPLVVDASAIKLKPGVGLGIRANGATLRPPIRFVTSAREAAKLAPKASKAVDATGHKEGVLQLPATVQDAALRSASLVVVIYSEKT